MRPIGFLPTTLSLERPPSGRNPVAVYTADVAHS